MSLVVLEDVAAEEAALRAAAETCVRRYAEPAQAIHPGEHIPHGTHVELQLREPGRKSFTLTVDRSSTIALFAQHTAEEFDLQLYDDANAIAPETERVWVAEHEHDDEVGSVAIEAAGDVDARALNRWLSDLLRERGPDIYRMKGFIAIAGDTRRFVFQGVHMLFDGQPEKPWGDAPRYNQLVFIGKNLDAYSMQQEFEACLL